MLSSPLSGLRGFLAMAAIGAASAMSPAGLGLGYSILPVTASARPQATKRIRTGTSSHSPGSYPDGPGWGHAKVKRMARKARNVKANLRNHRG